MAVSQATRKLAQAESHDKNLIQEATVTGMLHDIGRLILACSFPKRYAPMLEKLDNGDEKAFIKAETEEFGASHQETGAYLLAIWGLSDPVVEAVAYHHTPGSSSAKAFSPLVAVHVADCLLPPQPPESLKLPPNPPLDPDMEFLSRIGMNDKLSSWRAVLGLPPPVAPAEPAPTSNETK